MKMLLIHEGAWSTKSNIAGAIISLSVEDDQLHLIRGYKMVGEMWTNLQNYHERKSLCNKVGLMQGLY